RATLSCRRRLITLPPPGTGTAAPAGEILGASGRRAVLAGGQAGGRGRALPSTAWATAPVAPSRPGLAVLRFLFRLRAPQPRVPGPLGQPVTSADALGGLLRDLVVGAALRPPPVGG